MDRAGRTSSLMQTDLSRASHRAGHSVHRLAHFLERHVPRRAGLIATIAFLGGSLAFGVVRGQHNEEVVTAFQDMRDAAANAAGFNIDAVALSGDAQLSREEILATAGVSGRKSLLFLDAEGARIRLKANPWIADATVLKLFPDRLHIAVTERKAFALWQKDGRICVIASDGVVLQPYVSAHFTQLPLVVGAGAQGEAAAFLAMMDRFPLIRDQVRAYILVAERRWNLKMKNGLDVRLPSSDPERAIEALIALDRDKRLLTRDIASVDLRVADRITVRLSDGAVRAREEAQKDKDKDKAKRKGSDA